MTSAVLTLEDPPQSPYSLIQKHSLMQLIRLNSLKDFLYLFPDIARFLIFLLPHWLLFLNFLVFIPKKTEGPMYTQSFVDNIQSHSLKTHPPGYTYICLLPIPSPGLPLELQTCTSSCFPKSHPLSFIS